MPFEQVASLAASILSGWQNAPGIVVVKDMSDPRIRKAVRDENERQLSQGATGEPEGFFDAGKVYLVASEMYSLADVVRVMFHEALGYYGLRGVFGKSLHPILRQIAFAKHQELIAKAEQYGLDLSKESDRLIAAKELLAEMAQANPQIGFVKRAIAAIRTWLREHVPMLGNMALSDTEIIRNFIEPARAYVRGEVNLRAAGGAAIGFSRSGNNQSALVFYSQLSRGIESAKFESALGSQWKLWLQGNAGKLGVKKDEIQWTGVTDSDP